jgi:predicted XRE-type DNA-binding protein
MKTKKVVRDEHGPRHVTPTGRSVFHDLSPKAEADELVMRWTLLRGLEQWLKESGLTQTQAAKTLCITQARVSDIKRGKFGQFSLDMWLRFKCDGYTAHHPKTFADVQKRASISRLISDLPARKSHLNLQLLSRSRCPIRGRHA